MAKRTEGREEKEPERGLKIGFARRGRGESGLRGKQEPSAGCRAELCIHCHQGEENSAHFK